MVVEFFTNNQQNQRSTLSQKLKDKILLNKKKGA